MSNKTFCLLIAFFSLLSCDSERGFHLEQKVEGVTLLMVDGFEEGAWELVYPIYRFETGDIDGDGSTDAFVGVIKTTRFDPTLGRRIFIFKNLDGYVRPLWLGSRLGQKLQNFRVVKREGACYVRSLEKTEYGQFLVREYRWNTFGLIMDSTLSEGTDSTVAIEMLNHD